MKSSDDLLFKYFITVRGANLQSILAHETSKHKAALEENSALSLLKIIYTFPRHIHYALHINAMLSKRLKVQLIIAAAAT